ncbi:MAG: DUF3313 family protein [Acidobacteriota bacterium]
MKHSRPRIVILTLLAGLGLAVGARAASGPKGLEALVPRQGDFETTLVRPGADLSHYTRIVAEPVELEFRERVVKQGGAVVGSMISKRNKHIGTPKRKDVKMSQRAFDEVLHEELGHSSGFELVDKPGPGTLIVRPAVVDIVSRELLEAGRRSDPDKPPIVEGTIVFDLIDAETRVIQSRLSERREVEDLAGDAPGERFEPIARWARGAAADLVAELGKVLG